MAKIVLEQKVDDDRSTATEVPYEVAFVDLDQQFGPHLIFTGQRYRQRLMFDSKEMRTLVEWAFTQGFLPEAIIKQLFEEDR